MKQLPNLKPFRAALAAALPLASGMVSAQDNTTGPSSVLYNTIAAVIGLVILLLLVVIFQFIQVMNALSQQQQAHLSEEEKTTFWQRLVGLRSIAQEKKLLLDEDYDGIQELDNAVPGWFNALFAGTVGFGLLYLLVFHVWMASPLQDEEYTQDVAIAEAKRDAYLKKVAAGIDEKTVKQVNDAKNLEAGANIFKSQCATCHGQQGQGGIGPNLTDEYWLHGAQVQDIFKTIKYGVPEKGMISWQKQLNPLQIQQVSSFILKLQGTNPIGAKEPQGEKVTQKPDSNQVSMR